MLTITFYKTKGDISKPTLVMTTKKLKKSKYVWRSNECRNKYYTKKG